MREEIANKLGRRRDARALQPLVCPLEPHRSGLAAVHAAESLGTLGDPRAVEPLARLLCDGRLFARRSSLAVLRRDFHWTPRTPKEAAWATISEAEEEYAAFYARFREAWARNAAEELRVWGAEVVDELLAALVGPESKERISTAAGVLEVLGCLGDSRAVPVLSQFAKTEKEQDSLSATWALIEIGRPEVLPLLEELARSSRSVGAYAFSYDGQASVDDCLRRDAY